MYCKYFLRSIERIFNPGANILISDRNPGILGNLFRDDGSLGPNGVVLY
jgi:hypothetical protein